MKTTASGRFLFLHGEEIMAALKNLIQQLNQMQKQIPFATAQAMTKVVRQIETAQKTAFERHLESPTPFTVKSVGSVAARKNNLTAKVLSVILRLAIWNHSSLVESTSSIAVLFEPQERQTEQIRQHAAQ